MILKLFSFHPVFFEFLIFFVEHAFLLATALTTTTAVNTTSNDDEQSADDTRHDNYKEVTRNITLLIVHLRAWAALLIFHIILAHSGAFAPETVTLKTDTIAAGIVLLSTGCPFGRLDIKLSCDREYKYANSPKLVEIHGDLWRECVLVRYSEYSNGYVLWLACGLPLKAV